MKKNICLLLTLIFLLSATINIFAQSNKDDAELLVEVIPTEEVSNEKQDEEIVGVEESNKKEQNNEIQTKENEDKTLPTEESQNDITTESEESQDGKLPNEEQEGEELQEGLLEEPQNDIVIESEELQNSEEIQIEQFALESSDGDYWSKIADLKKRRSNSVLLNINNNIYAVGGVGDDGYLSSIEQYDTSKNTWTKITDIPNMAKGFSVVAGGDCIYIIGGYRNNAYLNEMQIYNTSTKKWSTGSPMKEGRDQAAAFYADNKIYIFGGRNVDGFVNSYECYNGRYWSIITTGFDASLIRVGASAKYMNGYICLYGGIDTNYNRRGVNVYSQTRKKEICELLEDGYEHISIAWGGEKALVFAYDQDQTVYIVKEIIISEQKIDISDISLKVCSSDKQYTSVIICNGYLYFIGGYNKGAKAYSLDSYKYSVNYGEYVTGDGDIDDEVTDSGNNIVLNVDNGKEYLVMINVKNLQNLSEYTFKIEYEDDSFDVIDTCALTNSLENGVGKVIGTDIIITKLESNGLSFEIAESPLDGNAVTQTVNAILLKSNSSGQRSIKYSMSK